MEEEYNDEMCEVVMHFKNEIQQRDFQIQYLTSALNNARELIKQMETELMSTQEEICMRSNSDVDSLDEENVDVTCNKKKRPKSEDVIKRWKFYHAHKSDPEVLQPLRDKLSTVGIATIPWTLIKHKTDELYRSLV